MGRGGGVLKELVTFLKWFLHDYQWLAGLLAGFFLNLIRDWILSIKEDRKLVRSIESIKTDINTEREFLKTQIPNLKEYKLSALKMFFNTVEEPVNKCLDLVAEMNEKIMGITNNMIREKYNKEYRLFSGHFSFWHNILKFNEYYKEYYDDSPMKRNEADDKQKFDFLMIMMKKSAEGLTDYLNI